MGRLRGTSKSGGRKKGTPNKKTLLLSDIIEQGSQSLPERILELLPKLPVDKQANVLLKLMEFIYPKRKAVEVLDREESPYDGLMKMINEKRLNNS